MENVKYYNCDQVGYIVLNGTLNAPKTIKIVAIKKLHVPNSFTFVEDVYDLNKNTIIKPNASLLGDYNLLYFAGDYMTRTGKRYGLNRIVDLPKSIEGYLSHGEKNCENDDIIYSSEKLSLIENYINKYLSSKFDNKEDQDKQMFDESERE